MKTHLLISDEVRTAVADGRPVVALESTVIAHGLPYPSNLETALVLESIARESGAVPATIAVLGGKMRVGLSARDIEYLAKTQGVAKLGTRDLPSALVRGLDGATTVSATSHIAAMAGVRVFATGGIGGVHRGAARTFDISADLWELANTGIIVVCAGAKAILDLPATLEWLETHGVPVLGYGTDEFPAFYSRRTNLPVERVDSAADVATRYAMQQRLGLRGATLVGVPIPHEYELLLDREVDEAVSEAERLEISGKAVTPWILARLFEMTGGRSVTANVALLKNNVRIGAGIARALASGWPNREDARLV